MRWGTSFLRDWVVELHRALRQLQTYLDTWMLTFELPVIILDSGALVKPPILLISVCPWYRHRTLAGPTTKSTGLPKACDSPCALRCSCLAQDLRCDGISSPSGLACYFGLCQRVGSQPQNACCEPATHLLSELAPSPQRMIKGRWSRRQSPTDVTTWRAMVSSPAAEMLAWLLRNQHTWPGLPAVT